MGRSRLIPALILFGALSVDHSGSWDSVAGQIQQAKKVVVTQKLPQAAIYQNPGALIPDYGKIPLYFIPNRGQVDGQSLFYAKTSRYTLWITREGLVFDATINKRKTDDLEWKRRMLTEDPDSVLREKMERETEANFNRDVSKVAFLGANKHPRMTALEPTENRVNYFIGNDPAKWQTDIPSSRAVLYEDLYPGIDLKVYGVESRVEYDWIIKPGARVEDIRFEYQDVSDSSIDASGDLIVKTALGEISHHKPISYQWIDGRKVEVSSEFINIGKDAYGFGVGRYDRAHDLVIDPILVYSTYLGGSGDDFATDIAVDSTGAAYVVGYTTSTNFPAKGSFQNKNKGKSDVFVTKFSPSGNALIYSTFLGGNDIDEAYGIALDKTAAAYITGMTYSYDFPIQNAYQGTIKECPDAFVTKLTPAGNALAYSTYLGGASEDRGKAIAVDDTGAAYVTGWTGLYYFYWPPGNDFPLKNPFQSVFGGGRDAFVVKFTPEGNDLVYSTYLGTGLADEGRAIAVDGRGCAYVGGYTCSREFPLKTPFQNIFRGYGDAFLSKFSPEGNAVIYSTYLGGAGWDCIYDIALDKAGAAYVTGETFSWNFPTKNAYQKTNEGTLDGFVTKFNPAGNSIAFSTFIGGLWLDQGGQIALDGSGAIYVIGKTGSLDFPLQNPYQKSRGGGDDAFLSKFSPTGTLAYSTYFGGNGNDRGRGIAIDPNGAVYLTGETYSPLFPLRTPYQKILGGGLDAFVTKLNIPQSAITVRAPDGGEQWRLGTTQIIQWDYTGKAGTSVRIALLKGEKTILVVAPNASIGKNGKGSFTWKIPANLASGEDYTIRITSTRHASLSDTSDAGFYIGG